MHPKDAEGIANSVDPDQTAPDLSLHCLPRPVCPKTLENYGMSHDMLTGRGSSIGSVFAWHASGPEFDPHVRHILSWRLGHENIFTAILPLPLIQEEQLSVTGERMCTKFW